MTKHIALIVVCALVTMLTRFLPFLIFNEHRKTPNIVLYLGKVLPCAIMGMLVVYCLKDVNFLSFPYGIPDFLGMAAVAARHRVNVRGEGIPSAAVGTEEQ